MSNRKIEVQVLSKLLDCSSLKEAHHKGVRLDIFTDDDLRSAYKFIENFAQRAFTPGSLPTRELVQETFGITIPADVTVPFDTLVAEAHTHSLRTRGMGFAAELVAGLEGMDPAKALLEANRKFVQLLTDTSGPRTKATTNDDYSLIEEAILLEERGFSGYKWCWEALNRGWTGIEPGLYLFSAQPKVGKTWILIKILAELIKLYPETTCLTWHSEMRTSELKRRFVQVWGSLPAIEKPFNLFTEAEKERAFEADEYNRLNGHRVIWDGNASSTKELDAIRTSVKKYRPSFLYVDSAYIAAGDLDYKSIMGFMQSLASLASDINIPVFASTQEDIRRSENRDKRSKSTLAFSNMQVAAADFAFKMVEHKNKITGEDEREIIPTYTRKKLPVEGITIAFKPAENFEQVYDGLMDDDDGDSDEEDSVRGSSSSSSSNIINLRHRQLSDR